MDAPEPTHQLLEGQRSSRGVERQDFAVQDEGRGHELASSRLDDVGQAAGHLGEPARPDPDSLTVSVQLDARAVVLVLERRGAAVGLEHVLEVLGDLGEHRQQRNERSHARRRERGGAAAGGQHRHHGQITEPQRRAPRALERCREGARDGFEHEPVGDSRSHFARDDPLERLPLVRRRPSRERAQQIVAGPTRAGAAGLGDLAERRREVPERQRRRRGRPVRERRQPADSEHTRIGLRKRAAREERDGGAHGVGGKSSQIVREHGELVEPARARAQPPAEIREPGELDHSDNHYKDS